MSKLQPAPEVLRSNCARPSAKFAFAWTIGLTWTLVGCLSPNGGDTTDVVLGSETDQTSAGGTTGVDSTTKPGVMTTTEEPETTTSGSDSTDSSTSSSSGMPDTTMTDPLCGNGSIEPGEECDEGPENADDGTCTTKCLSATCGDGVVQAGIGEVCDDMLNDGSYGNCGIGCKELGPRCGDGEVTEGIEACDSGEPWVVVDGCLSNCKYAQSCKQIREAFPDDDGIVDGVFTIKPADKPLLDVYCDMDTEGGGYTYLKIALPGSVEMTAMEAEKECDKYGMNLLVPRTQKHLMVSTVAATSSLLAPIGGGTVKSNIEYLSILGIYPVTPGESCVGQPLNGDTCPAWKPKNGGPYSVTTVAFPGQPNTTNCAYCSMLYTWTAGGTLLGYEAFVNGGKGATSQLFMCDTGDKQGV